MFSIIDKVVTLLTSLLSPHPGHLKSIIDIVDRDNRHFAISLTLFLI